MRRRPPSRHLLRVLPGLQLPFEFVGPLRYVIQALLLQPFLTLDVQPTDAHPSLTIQTDAKPIRPHSDGSVRFFVNCIIVPADLYIFSGFLTSRRWFERTRPIRWWELATALRHPRLQF